MISLRWRSQARGELPGISLRPLVSSARPMWAFQVAGSLLNKHARP
jgi:hypothetical protein